MCVQDARNGQHSSPSHSHPFARFLHRNWLGWNSTDSFFCLKICSCRRKGESLREVLSKTVRKSPQRTSASDTSPPSTPECRWLSPACRSARSSWSSRRAAGPSPPASAGAEHGRPAARSCQEGTPGSFPLLPPEVFVPQRAGARGGLQP